MSAPPRESLERGKELYEPIAKKLSEILGQTVVYEQPNGWADYSQKMRSDHYDIVFDGPHFTAWRVKNLKHMPVATLPGHLGFVLVTSTDEPDINTPRDLVGKRICGMVSPHLATDMIYDLYKNPVLQPDIHEVKGGMMKMYEAFKAGECKATIFRDNVFKNLPQADKDKLKIIARTRNLPNQTFTVSARLKNNASSIAEFLTSKDGAIVADSLLGRYSKNNKMLLQTQPEQFVGVEELLQDVWGW
ncbi:phosphate/phosphite/phosphonate ABC transporter substrate-binding protein [Kaarinaea lacus]